MSWINRVWLPILLWSAGQENEPFLVPVRARDFWTGSTVPSRVSLLLHTQAEFDAYSRDSSRFPLRHPSNYGANSHRVSHEIIRSRITYRWRSPPRVRRHRASIPQVRFRKRVLPFQVSPWADYCAPLFPHIHYWYGVRMLKVLEYSVFVLAANQWTHLNVSTPLPAPDVMYPSSMAVTFSTTLDINRYDS